MEIRSVGGSPAGVRSVTDGGVAPQSAQNMPSQQVAVQTARAVPQVTETDSASAMRRPADMKGGELLAGANTASRQERASSRLEGQRRAGAQESTDPASEASRSRVTDANQARNARPLDEAAMQAEKERTQEAVDSITKSLSEMSRSNNLQFSVDEELGRVIVKVVDPETDEVIKQIPSEDAIALAKSLGKMTGVLLKAQA